MVGCQRGPCHGRRRIMSNCCETRKSREFCGCDAWLDGLAHGVVGDGRNFCVVSNCCADGALAPCHGRRRSVANCCAGLTGWPMACNACACSICRKGGSFALAGSATGIHTATADLCGQFCNCLSTAEVVGTVRLILLQAKRSDPQRPPPTLHRLPCLPPPPLARKDS